jgi:hypothetical protein
MKSKGAESLMNSKVNLAPMVRARRRVPSRTATAATDVVMRAEILPTHAREVCLQEFL